MKPRYMLDTNICIYLIKNQPPAVATRFSQCRVGDVVISAITYAELHDGVAKSAQSRRAADQLKALISQIPVAAFDEEAAHTYGPLRLSAGSSRQDQLDTLIAAHAQSLGVALVTNNLKDFAHYPGLRTENWLEP